MRRVVIATIAAAAVGAFPAWAGAATFKGIVVGKSAARGTIAVASARGAVHTLRVHSLVRIGSVVTATGTLRADGTYAAKRVSVRGRAHRAHIRGVVAARTHARLLLSAGKSMILVHTGTRALAAAGDDTPAVGTAVDTEVEIENDGDLDEQETTEVGEQKTVEIEGTVVGIAAGSIQVRIEGGVIVTVAVPATIHLTLAVGDEVELKASVQGSTLTLVSAESEDEDEGDGSDD